MNSRDISIQYVVVVIQVASAAAAAAEAAEAAAVAGGGGSSLLHRRRDSSAECKTHLTTARVLYFPVNSVNNRWIYFKTTTSQPIHFRFHLIRTLPSTPLLDSASCPIDQSPAMAAASLIDR